MPLHIRLARRAHLMVNWVLWRRYPLPNVSDPRAYLARRESWPWRLNDWLASGWTTWWLEHRHD
jgi:hypothetical protein